jgi:hypothetical protein
MIKTGGFPGLFLRIHQSRSIIRNNSIIEKGGQHGRRGKGSVERGLSGT